MLWLKFYNVSKHQQNYDNDFAQKPQQVNFAPRCPFEKEKLL